MKSGYETLIILDRDLDMVTPFLTEFSYYGLIDHTFGLHFNRIYIEDFKVFLDKDKPDPGKLPCEASRKPERRGKVCPNMTCQECPPRVWFDLATIFDAPPKDESVSFAKWKHLSFNDMNKQLREQVKGMVKMENEQKALATSMDSIDFKIKFLDLKKFIKAHTNIAKTVNDTLNEPTFQFYLKLSQKLVGDFQENLAAKILSMADAEEPLHRVLSLALLFTFVRSGLKAGFLEALTDRIFDNYGYRGTQVVFKLREAGLLFSSEENSREGLNPRDLGAFVTKKDSLDLIMEENTPQSEVSADARPSSTAFTRGTRRSWRRTSKASSTKSTRPT